MIHDIKANENRWHFYVLFFKPIGTNNQQPTVFYQCETLFYEWGEKIRKLIIFRN